MNYLWFCWLLSKLDVHCSTKREIWKWNTIERNDDGRLTTIESISNQSHNRPLLFLHMQNSLEQRGNSIDDMAMASVWSESAASWHRVPITISLYRCLINDISMIYSAESVSLGVHVCVSVCRYWRLVVKLMAIVDSDQGMTMPALVQIRAWLLIFDRSKYKFEINIEK